MAGRRGKLAAIEKAVCPPAGRLGSEDCEIVPESSSMFTEILRLSLSD